jgi:hypothetical protein
LGLTSRVMRFLSLVLSRARLNWAVQILDGDEIDRVAGYDCLGAERNRQVRLAHTGRSEQQHVLLAFQEGESSQLAELAFVDRRLKVKSN